MTLLAWFALLTLVIWLGVAIDVMVGGRSVVALRDIAPVLPPSPPTVSIIVAARNEERNIAEALTSLLRLNYPDYELIVVNDRSDDGTGAILAALAASDPRLKVITITTLPAGWLGKNHALWTGANQARGELLLFTDADIVMEPTVLSRAVTLLHRDRLDFLAVSPSMTMPTPFLQMFGSAFIVFFSIFARPWKARDPKSPRHIGIGAFNLLRAEAYRAVGGHSTIRLRPDDDLKLGKIVKGGGFSCDIAGAPDFLFVEWYSSVNEVIRGLEKNAFAGCDYRIGVALPGSLFLLVGIVWPYLAVIVTRGPAQLLYAGVVLLLTLLVADCAALHGGRRWHAVAFPLCSALFAWIILRTTILNLAQGGITWRGTFYSLKELKSNRV